MRGPKIGDLERRALSDLVPYARNARGHDDEQVAQLAASIREWGFTVPVLIDEDNGIIAGHGRVMAARKLGLDEVPVIVASGWSEAQKRAYILADNKLAENSTWDREMLAEELQELEALSFDAGLTGFSEIELEGLLSTGSDFFDEGGDEEEADEEEREPTKSTDGFVEFALVMAEENKRKLVSTLNAIKRDEGLDRNEDALMFMVLRHG